MIEKIGEKQVYVRDYTSGANIKEFIQDVLIKKAFPNIPVNKLNLGYTGITSELMSNAIEDAYGTASLMMNESFITRAIMPESIYANAAIFDIGYTYATPSSGTFVLEILVDDIVKNAKLVEGTHMKRFILDKDTRVICGDYSFRLDYDIIIEYQVISGKRAWRISYDMSDPCFISTVKNKYIRHQTYIDEYGAQWLLLRLNLREFDRRVSEHRITDNMVTTNSDIILSWSDQIAGIDLTYITPTGQRRPMELRVKYGAASTQPFAWYSFIDDNSMRLSFTSNGAYFVPAFNSNIEATVYTCHGTQANFDSYSRTDTLPVEKTGSKYDSNSKIAIVALCTDGTTGGMNRGTIENVRNDTILAYNTANAITTDHDINLFLKNYSQRAGNRSLCFKRRDDPTGRLFSTFVTITDGDYVYPTNTLTMDIDTTMCDEVINDVNGVNEEFVIMPGHLWEYGEIDEGLVTESYLTYERACELLDRVYNDDVDDAGDDSVNDLPLDKAEEFFAFAFEYSSVAGKFNHTITIMEDCSCDPGCPSDYLPYDRAADIMTNVNLLKGNSNWYEQILTLMGIEDEEESYLANMNRVTVRMVQGQSGPAMITDEVLPTLNDKRPFMFVNPFYIKIYRDPTVSANYNCLIDKIDFPEEIYVNPDSFYQYQISTMEIVRSLTPEEENKYIVEVSVVPVSRDEEFNYVEGIGEDFPEDLNNMRVVMVLHNRYDGEAGYVEMTPIEITETSYIKFRGEITVKQNIDDNMMLEVDLEKSTGVHSIVQNGERVNKVFIDTQESRFDFITLMKNPESTTATTLFENPTYKGYTITNRFSNNYRELQLFKPLSMMRSALLFSGENNAYRIRASLMPLLKWDIPLDHDKMNGFIRAFDTHYASVRPILDRIGGNSTLDFKLYNTYGRSNNYYIGPQDGTDTLKASNLLLDNIYVKVKIVMSVYDRSLYTQTCSNVVNDIKLFFNALGDGSDDDLHVSDLITYIKSNEPNVNYIRFVGFNSYDANKQSIFVKFNSIDDLKEDQLHIYVPEIIRVDEDSIEIIEEVDE